MNKHNFIFIGGLHRSGTWLQTHCLETHPEVSRLGTVNRNEKSGKPHRSEGQFLQTVYPEDQAHGGVGRFGFDPDAHMTEDSLLVTAENRRQIWKEWSRYWDTSRPYLLEKTPSNLIRSRFLQELFPRSTFIFVMRHPVSVALAQQKWTGTSVSSLIEHWLVCHETMREDLPALRRFLRVNYESFIHSPASTMSRIYEFLQLTPQAVSTVVRSNGNDVYFNTWRRAIAGIGPDATLSRRLVRLVMPRAIHWGYPISILANEADYVISRFEERVNAFGYSLRDLDRFDNYEGTLC